MAPAACCCFCFCWRGLPGRGVTRFTGAAPWREGLLKGTTELTTGPVAALMPDSRVSTGRMIASCATLVGLLSRALLRRG